MKQWKKAGIVFIFVIFIFSSFGCSNNADKTVVVDTGNDEGNIDVKNIVINIPAASGTVVYEKNGTVIDASNTKDGYIMVKNTGSDKKLKVKVIRDEGSYTYDLNNKGNYEVYPLQMGNGIYSIKIYENVENTAYTVLYAVDLRVEMYDTDRVFVFPNQYVWYTNSDKAVEKSIELCEGITSDEKKAEIIYKFVTAHIKYDNEKAANVKSGYLPDVDETLASGKGICFDYSVLMAAMLRAQGIPARLVIGNVEPENILHAWNQVYINGKWVWMDATFGAKDRHQEKDYTENRKY